MAVGIALHRHSGCLQFHHMVHIFACYDEDSQLRQHVKAVGRKAQGLSSFVP
jgi:hypothetical protein